jgi:8-oxo-dGTP pyrophosphatase MutT (NUDIX family)
MRLIAQSIPHLDPSAAWSDGNRRIVADSPIFSLEEIERESPRGQKKGTFYRLACPEWVHAVPFTPADNGLEIIAVEQFRHGIDGSSLEFPGGVCNPGESPLDAAKRELLEETGYASDNWAYLGYCTPNPAIQNNKCHYYLALDCVQVHELSLDPTEELRVWAVPYSEWMKKMESGEIHHGLILAGFERLRLSKAWATILQGKLFKQTP